MNRRVQRSTKPSFVLPGLKFGAQMIESNRIRVLVVDDEPLARGMVREMLEADPEAEIVGECSNGRDAISAIKSLSPDLIFLDVQMPELGGFDVLEAFKDQHLPRIIFVTAYDQYAVRAFDVHALDYLLKPFDRERFMTAWQRAKLQISKDQFEQRDQHIMALLEELKAGPRYIERLVVKSAGRVFFLEVNTIDCIEAEGNYVRIHSGAKSHLLRETISGLEAQLDPREFLRIHRSAIVRIDRIKELQPWFHGEYVVILKDGTKLTSSAAHSEALHRIIDAAK